MIRILHILSRGLAALPFRTTQRIGAAAGGFAGSVLRHRRRETRETLARCLPERSPAERESILRNMYRHLGMTVAEQLRISVNGLDELEERVTIRGREHLDAAIRDSGSVIALMAHLGNWELCGFMSRIVRRPIHVVVKPMRNPRFEQYLTQTRERMGLHLLPAASSYRQCMKALRDGDFVAMIMDQNTKRSRGVFVDFFGRPACTTTGLALLSAQSGKPVLPLFVLRRDDGTFELTIDPVLPPPPDRDPETLRDATRQYTRIIEDRIRADPDQWIWIHRRWRTTPKPGDL